MRDRDFRPLLALVHHRYPQEVAVTSMSGIEYGLNDDGTFSFAWRTVSGYDLTEEEFLATIMPKAARALVEKYRGFGFKLSPPGTWTSIYRVMGANDELGRHWFEQDTMRAFGTWQVKLYAGCLLTFSDRNYDDTGRDHKIAFVDVRGDVHTVVDAKFPTTGERDEFAAAVVDALNEEGSQ